MHSSASHTYVLGKIYMSTSFTTSGNAYLSITTYSRQPGHYEIDQAKLGPDVWRWRNISPTYWSGMNEDLLTKHNSPQSYL